MSFCFILKLKFILFYFLSFVFIRCTNPYHWLSLIISCYHSLSFVVTHCHSFSLDLSLAVIRCPSLYHSLSFVVPLVLIRCHPLYHSLSLDEPLVYIFIYDRKTVDGMTYCISITMRILI